MKPGESVAHGQPGDRDMPPKRLAIANKHDGAVELVRPAGQVEQMASRGLHVDRLVEDAVAERQRLVAADDQGAGMALADVAGLGLRQYLRDLVRRDAGLPERRFQRSLIEIGADSTERQARHWPSRPA